MTHRMAILLGVCVMVSAPATADDDPPRRERSLRVGTVVKAESPLGVALERCFAASPPGHVFERMPDGPMLGVLDPEPDIVAALVDGRADVALISFRALRDVMPELAALEIPFHYTPSQARRLSTLAGEMLEGLPERFERLYGTRVELVGRGDIGHLLLFLVKPLERAFDYSWFHRTPKRRFFSWSDDPYVARLFENLGLEENGSSLPMLGGKLVAPKAGGLDGWYGPASVAIGYHLLRGIDTVVGLGGGRFHLMQFVVVARADRWPSSRPVEVWLEDCVRAISSEAERDERYLLRVAASWGLTIRDISPQLNARMLVAARDSLCQWLADARRTRGRDGASMVDARAAQAIERAFREVTQALGLDAAPLECGSTP